MTGKSSSNTPTKLPNGDSIMVYPFGMHFRQAQCFCKSLNNGHLASIHDEVEYQALEAAAKLAGVTTAIFVGGHETAEEVWEWTDGTAYDRAWVDTHSVGFDNYQGNNEDSMAYCGSDCRKTHNWGSDCPPPPGQTEAPDDPTYSCQPQHGFHDWRAPKPFAHRQSKNRLTRILRGCSQGQLGAGHGAHPLRVPLAARARRPRLQQVHHAGKRKTTSQSIPRRARAGTLA